MKRAEWTVCKWLKMTRKNGQLATPKGGQAWDSCPICPVSRWPPTTISETTTTINAPPSSTGDRNIGTARCRRFSNSNVSSSRRGRALTSRSIIATMLQDRIESSTSLDRLDSTEKAIGSTISLADKQDHASENPEPLSRPSNIKKGLQLWLLRLLSVPLNHP